MELFGSPKRPKTDDLEVTGISRSGRVRKKSSKLMDFESPDDLTDSKYKRQKAQQLQAQQLLDRYETQQAVAQGHSSQQGNANRQRKNSGSQPSQQKIKAEPMSDNEEQSSASDSDDAAGLNEEERFSMESASDDDVDPLMIDDRETGFRRLEPPSQANSLYMLEKCKKKLIIKDGKIIGRMKAQRKDKGKTRFTAYMLWAKEIRQELLEQYPHMDFAAISKRLGELWATVPNLEKYNWRRRAKRLASKPHITSTTKEEPTWKMPPPASRKKFINKIGNGQESKPSSSKKTIQLGVPSVVGNIPVSPPSNRTGKDLVNEPVIGTGMYKVVGTQPVDVAAHLKLLDSEGGQKPFNWVGVQGNQKKQKTKARKRGKAKYAKCKKEEMQPEMVQCKVKEEPMFLSKEEADLPFEQSNVDDLFETETYKVEPLESNELDPLDISAASGGVNSTAKTRRPRSQRKTNLPGYTAYTLWSKDIRKALLAHDPQMDFSTVNKRLSELWASVSNQEKYNWRRRAKLINVSIQLSRED